MPELCGLIQLITACAAVQPAQKAQLDVYGVWGVLRGELLADAP